MKKLIYLFILTLGIISCNSDNEISHGKVEFISEYSTTVTVGGIVGINERTFEIGEIYKVTDQSGETVTLRIAQHSELNEDCPNSWCYQEILEVPKEFLRFVE
jgi:hypothetical protein